MKLWSNRKSSIKNVLKVIGNVNIKVYNIRLVKYLAYYFLK